MIKRAIGLLAASLLIVAASASARAESQDGDTGAVPDRGLARVPPGEELAPVPSPAGDARYGGCKAPSRKRDGMLDGYNLRFHTWACPDSIYARAEKLVSTGWSAFLNNDQAGAIALYEQAIALAPDFGMSYAARGVALMEADFPAAEADFKTALRLDSNEGYGLPDRISLFTYRAVHHFNHGDCAQAMRDATSAVGQGLGPQVEAYQVRARCFIAAKNYKAALEEAWTAIGGDKDNPDNYVLRGLIYAYMKDSKALADLEHTRSMELRSGALAYEERAEAYRLLGKPRDAAENYTRAYQISGNPKFLKQAEASEKAAQ